MRLARAFQLASLLLLPLSAIGCGEPSRARIPAAAEAEARANGLETWVHPRGGVSFVLPAGWKVAEATDEVVVLDPGLAPEAAHEGSVRIAFAPLAPGELGLSLEGLHAVYERGLQASLPRQGIAILGREGAPEALATGAVRGRWRARSELGQLLLDTVILVDGGCYATIDLMCLESARSRFASGMDVLARGLALDPAAIQRVAAEARPATPGVCDEYELARAQWNAEEQRYLEEMRYWQQMQGNFPGNDLPMPADKDMKLHMRAENLRLRCAAARQAAGDR
ncbi:MAG: hypothetical protein RL112_535 [Planctomycetota bacterium]|jgi:hypothetical protein